MNTIKTTIHYLIETSAGIDYPTHSTGGFASFYKTEAEAKECLASLAKERGLEHGEGDGDKWADRRWDIDDTIAWNDDDGILWKCEYFQKEIEIPVPTELTDLANAAIAYGNAIADRNTNK